MLVSAKQIRDRHSNVLPELYASLYERNPTLVDAIAKALADYMVPPCDAVMPTWKDRLPRDPVVTVAMPRRPETTAQWTEAITFEQDLLLYLKMLGYTTSLTNYYSRELGRLEQSLNIFVYSQDRILELTEATEGNTRDIGYIKSDVSTLASNADVNLG